MSFILQSATMLLTCSINRLNSLNAYPKRHFWHWLNLVFNQVDESRRKIVGPDRSCAEWLLKNGGSVRWTMSTGEFLSDYNLLPPEHTSVFIKDVDASDSSIMHYGFRHFERCKHVESIIFHNCSYLEDEALGMLTPLNSTLKLVQVSDCQNISARGLLNLASLTNLQELSLFELISVQDLTAITKELQSKLPRCFIGKKDFRQIPQP